MLGVAFEEQTDFVVALHGDTKNVIGEVANAVFQIAAFRPESFLNVLDRLFPHVCLEEHLQRQFA
jgi:hypothetical protein